jgi:hypothetical protein
MILFVKKNRNDLVADLSSGIKMTILQENLKGTLRKLSLNRLQGGKLIYLKTYLYYILRGNV